MMRNLNPTKSLLRATAAVWLTICLGSAAPSHGGGVTAHVVAGELVIDQIEDPYLKDVLKREREAFLSGTAIPDELLQIEQGTQALHKDFGTFSHGTAQGRCDAPRGYEHQLWTQYKECEAKRPKSGENSCEGVLALLMGILTHEITDAPWHHQFIDVSSAKLCEPCQTSTTVNGSYVSCHPGGVNVSRDATAPYPVTSGQAGRHQVADTDFDLCLASRLSGNKNDLPNIRNTFLNRPASFVSQGQSVCPSGSVFDPRNSGECWKCKSGTVRTGYPVNTDKACTTNLGGLGLRTADHQSSIGCKDGEFRNAAGDGCYSCPGGYEHNALLPVGTDGVCFKRTDAFPYIPKLTTANYQHPYGGCSGGQFENAAGDACYSCPSGYEHNSAFTVDTPGVCYKVETLSRATFVAKATPPCPSGGSVELLSKGKVGECWSCPSGYTRNLLQPDVTKPTACTGPGLTRCSLVELPGGVTGKLPVLPGKVLPALLDALKRAGVSAIPVNAATIMGMVGSMQAFQKTEPGLVPVIATPAATVCSQMLAQGVSAPGALRDSAKETARFLNALWKNRQQPGVTIISFDDYEKAVVSNKTVLYRNGHRPCKTEGQVMGDCTSDSWICEKSQCIYNPAKDTSCGGKK